MQPLETDTDGKVRKRRCLSAVDGGIVILDKKSPAEVVLADCLEPCITR
jgi:hypothetical protein